MKLLVVSHACATPLNQSFFAEVEQITGWSLSLVLPDVWRTEYGERQAERWSAFQGGFHPTPVIKSGNIPLHLYRSFFGHLRTFRPDAIYVQHEPYGAATAQVYIANLLHRQVPVGFYAAQNIVKKYPPPFRWTESLVLKNSSFCFPVTNDALEVLRTKGYKGDAEILPLAIDTALYHPRPVAAAALRQRLGISSRELIIGYLGRLVPEKGLMTLAKALGLLKVPNWRCVLVGNGPLQEDFSAAIQAAGLSGRVSFAGYVPHTEAPDWMSLFDVLALPSETQPNWKEQFGRVIVEANACGTPVVGTQCGEIPAVIEQTGGGLTVPEASPDQLAIALDRILENEALRTDLGEAGRVAAHREYGQQHLATRFSATVARHMDLQKERYRQ